MDSTTPFEVDDVTDEDLRKLYFNDDRNDRYSLIRRKIAVEVKARITQGAGIDLDALRNEVYAKALERFVHWVSGFREKKDREKKDRPPTSLELEKWLHVCIRHQVQDAVRTHANRRIVESIDIEDFGNTGSEEAVKDTDRDESVRKWLTEALDTLTNHERYVLHERFVEQKPPRQIATESGVKTERIYKTIYDAKLKLRGAMIAKLVRRCFARAKDRVAAEECQRLIERRCKSGHACYLYRLDCPEALTITQLAAQNSLGIAPDQVQRQMDRLTGLVQATLDDWDMGRELNRCQWAKAQRDPQNSSENLTLQSVSIAEKRNDDSGRL